MAEPWSREWVAKQLADLAKKWKKCTACSLLQDRKHVVFGRGNPTAKVMLIGEAPGEEEDAVGEPFVGRSGDLLRLLLDSLSIGWDDLYVTNLVMCHPPENRPPLKEEGNNCRGRLCEEIYLVDPLIIVPVGKSAMQELMGTADPISKRRGKHGTVRMMGRKLEVTYDAIPIYHPAYLLRKDPPVKNQWKAGGDTDNTRKDLEMIFNVANQVSTAYEHRR